MSSDRKLHAIMISVPYQGHINPFVSLALNLASRGIVVTFVHLEFIHHRLLQAHAAADLDVFSDARRSGLDIRYTTISDGFPLEFDRDLHIVEYWTSLFRDFPVLVDEFVGKLIRSADPGLVHFLVADTCYSWPESVARKYHLVNVSFWSQPALVFCLCYHWDILKEKGHVPQAVGKQVEINYVPGVRSISTRDLPSCLTEEGLVPDNMKQVFDDVKKADFILHNVVQELEPNTLSALSEHQPNYAIGPISFSGGISSNFKTATSMQSEADIQWLDTKSPGSVLYISFGSIVQIPKEAINEIAHGLLASGVEFIWVIRAGIAGHGLDAGILPDGYEEEIKHRGVVVPWCDQIAVLSNPAVGGFLTHCGWNSTVESLWCGVPMLCYPVTYDQPTARKLVVDDWRVGIDLGDDGASVVGREDVGRKIRMLMMGECSERLRREANRVKEIVSRAVKPQGSSSRNFDRFIMDLKSKIQNYPAGR